MTEILCNESSSLHEGRDGALRSGGFALWSARVQRAGWIAAYLVARLLKALRHRREVWQLTEFDERALHDIGLVRSDVAGALAQPLHSDPSIILAERAEKRVAKPMRRA